MITVGLMWLLLHYKADKVELPIALPIVADVLIIYFIFAQ